jgi:hypothetical protein
MRLSAYCEAQDFMSDYGEYSWAQCGPMYDAMDYATAIKAIEYIHSCSLATLQCGEDGETPAEVYVNNTFIDADHDVILIQDFRQYILDDNKADHKFIKELDQLETFATLAEAAR